MRQDHDHPPGARRRERKDRGGARQIPRPRGRISLPRRGGDVSSVGIVFKKEILEILRDRRTLIAIALAVLATPTVLFVISQAATRTATQAYTAAYSGAIPAGLEGLFRATGLSREPADDPAAAAKRRRE